MHCALRYRGTNDGGDGHLSRGSRGTKAARTRDADLDGPTRSRHGGGATPPSAEAHDRLDHRGGIVIHFFGQSRGVGGATTSTHPTPSRHAPCPPTPSGRPTPPFSIASPAPTAPP